MKWTMATATAILALANAASADMILEKSQTANVSVFHDHARFEGNSRATVAAGGYIGTAVLLDNASLVILGGHVESLTAGGSSSVEMSGGVRHLYALDEAVITVSGYWFHSYEQHMHEDDGVSVGWPGWLRWTTGWPEEHIDHMMYVADRSAASTIRLVTTADPPIPEPAAAALVAVGFLGIFLRRAGRRRIM